jgi:polysaccharide export outer membrane protein
MISRALFKIGRRHPQLARFLVLGLLLSLLSPGLFAQGQDYLLGPGDKLRVTVFGEPYLTGEYTVSANGSISMPLIEPVQVGGRTVFEAEDLVEQGLRSGFMGEPNVAVEVLAYRPFFVIGEVKNPGSYPYVADMTVLHAVAIAGGFTPRAAKNKIIIQRDGEEIESVQNTTPVKPDDIVTVKERFF